MGGASSKSKVASVETAEDEKKDSPVLTSPETSVTPPETPPVPVVTPRKSSAKGSVKGSAKARTRSRSGTRGSIRSSTRDSISSSTAGALERPRTSIPTKPTPTNTAGGTSTKRKSSRKGSTNKGRPKSDYTLIIPANKDSLTPGQTNITKTRDITSPTDNTLRGINERRTSTPTDRGRTGRRDSVNPWPIRKDSTTRNRSGSISIAETEQRLSSHNPWPTKDSSSTASPGSISKGDRTMSDLPTIASSMSFTPPDGGWRAWLICFSSFLANGTVFGVINTYGIMLPHVAKHYDIKEDSYSRTVLVGSICTGMIFFFSAVASIFNDSIGIRRTAYIGSFLGMLGLLTSAFAPRLYVLYVTFGLVLGLGGAFLISPSLVILSHYFRKHLGLVNGIVGCGSVAISTIESVTLQSLLETIGVSYTFMVLGSLYGLVMCFVPLWKPNFKAFKPVLMLTPRPRSGSMRKLQHSVSSFTKKHINMSIWSSTPYKMWLFSLFIGTFGYFVPYAFLTSHVKQKMPESNGAYLITCAQIGSGVGRLAVGKIADFPWVKSIRLQQGGLFFLGVLTILIPVADKFAYLVAITFGLGIAEAAYFAILGPIAYDIVGNKNLSQAMGFVLGGMAIPLSVGPVLAGLLRDRQPDYTLVFYIAGIPSIVGSITIFGVSTKSAKDPNLGPCTASLEIARARSLAPTPPRSRSTSISLMYGKLSGVTGVCRGADDIAESPKEGQSQIRSKSASIVT